MYVGAALWILTVGAGMRAVISHAYTPGLGAEAPERWPANARIQPERDRATLIMLAHPQCPCTRASLGELALLMARLRGRLTAHVLFYQPEQLPSGWTRSDLWDQASSIPGVIAAWDPGGAEAQLFGGATSGQVLVYDPRGRLLFSGGITASRGHSGDNLGRSAIVSAVTSSIIERRRTPVFGCSLLNVSPRRLQQR